MSKIMRAAVGAAFALVSLQLGLLHTASAQQGAPTARIRGQIQNVDGSMLSIKARDGNLMKVKLADNPRVMALVKASLSDIKPGAYIGVTAMPQPDGSQKAIAIHIFLESQRGTNEGFRPWDRVPGSTMTNAAVDSTVAGVDGQVITVKYKDGEKKVMVPPGTPIVAYTPGNKDEIVPGAQVFIVAATKQDDGTYLTPAINIGRGVTPPM